jgi:glycyl-tRNA synthetase beta subunit
VGSPCTHSSMSNPCLMMTHAGVVPDSASGDLLDEVANLVESPTVVLGGFDPAFLALPRCATLPGLR